MNGYSVARNMLNTNIFCCYFIRAMFHLIYRYGGLVSYSFLRLETVWPGWMERADRVRGESHRSFVKASPLGGCIIPEYISF